MNDDYTAWELVRAFHLRYGHAAPDALTALSPEVRLLRQRLILEELGELAVAVHQRDLIKIADAGCDLAYVLHGTAVAAGKLSRSMWTYDPVKSAIERPSLTRVALSAATCCAKLDTDGVAYYVEAAVLDVGLLLRSLRIPFEACFREVHASNMTKAVPSATKPGEKYGDGEKTGKGATFVPPDLRAILRDAGLTV